MNMYITYPYRFLFSYPISSVFLLTITPQPLREIPRFFWHVRHAYIDPLSLQLYPLHSKIYPLFFFLIHILTSSSATWVPIIALWDPRIVVMNRSTSSSLSIFSSLRASVNHTGRLRYGFSIQKYLTPFINARTCGDHWTWLPAPLTCKACHRS